MTTHQHDDMYYENPASRSPGSHRHGQQVLHRQPSRQFDAYGGLPTSNLFSPDDQMAQQNFAPRGYDRLNAATINSNFPFVQDPWNSFSAAQNPSLAALGATTRMKPLANRGRAGLPSVGNPSPLLFASRV